MRHFERLLAVLSATALVGLMLVVLVDVIGRNLFNRPLAAGTELTELMLAAMSFLAFPLLAWRQRDITVDLFDFLGGARLRRVQWALAGAVGAAVYALLARQAWVFAGRAATSGEATAQLKFPLAWAWWSMSALAVVAALACLGVFASAFVRRPFAPLAAEIEEHLGARHEVPVAVNVGADAGANVGANVDASAGAQR